MAQYDLTKTIVPYLDRHLAFPLLAHLGETALFPEDQVRVAQYELAKGTNMVDYSVTLFEQLHPGEPIPDGELHLVFCNAYSYTGIAKNLRTRGKRLSSRMSGYSTKPKPSSM